MKNAVFVYIIYINNKNSFVIINNIIPYAYYMYKIY